MKVQYSVLDSLLNFVGPTTAIILFGLYITPESFGLFAYMNLILLLSVRFSIAGYDTLIVHSKEENSSIRKYIPVPFAIYSILSISVFILNLLELKFWQISYQAHGLCLIYNALESANQRKKINFKYLFLVSVTSLFIGCVVSAIYYIYLDLSWENLIVFLVAIGIARFTVYQFNSFSVEETCNDKIELINPLSLMFALINALEYFNREFYKLLLSGFTSLEAYGILQFVTRYVSVFIFALGNTVHQFLYPILRQGHAIVRGVDISNESLPIYIAIYHIFVCLVFHLLGFVSPYIITAMDLNPEYNDYLGVLLIIGAISVIGIINDSYLLSLDLVQMRVVFAFMRFGTMLSCFLYFHIGGLSGFLTLYAIRGFAMEAIIYWYVYRIEPLPKLLLFITIFSVLWLI